MVLHNYFFPLATMRLEGFVEVAEALRPVYSQPSVCAERNATSLEIHTYLNTLGFEPVFEGDFQNLKLGIFVHDLHGDNVLVDDACRVVVIDPLIFAKKL